MQFQGMQWAKVSYFLVSGFLPGFGARRGFVLLMLNSEQESSCEAGV